MRINPITSLLQVQLERALSSNAMLEGRNQLLEQFVGLQVNLCSAHTSLWTCQHLSECGG